MTKKEKIIFVIKLILELAVFILLVLIIIHLTKSETGVLARNAKEKLDTAIKIFTSTDGMKLEDSLRSIEGLNDLQIDNETGEYSVKIDGQEFLVISREIIPEEEQNKISEGEENGQENKD